MQRLGEFSANCNHELRPEHLSKCEIAIPVQNEFPPVVQCDMSLGDKVVSIGMPVAEEEPDTLETEYGPTPLQEDKWDGSLIMNNASDANMTNR